MKKWKRILISALVFLVTFQVFLPNFKLPTAQAEAAKTPPVTQTEIISARTATSKTYLKSNGTKQLVTYSQPIHYPVATKGVTAWKEIDNSLNKTSVSVASAQPNASVLNVKSSTTQMYSNKANDFSVGFSDKLTQFGSQISKNNSSVLITPKTFLVNGKLQSPYAGQAKSAPSISSFLLQKSNPAQQSFLSSSVFNTGNIYPLSATPTAPVAINLNSVAPTQLRNMLIYKGIAQDTDLIYYSVNDGIKEDIILNKYYGQNTFKFDVNVTNAIFGKNTDGSYSFYDKTSRKLIFYIPKMYMWDSRGGKGGVDYQYSFSVNSVITPKISGGYEMTITADHNWLANPARVYPVTIDPSIGTGVPYGLDTYVQEGFPDTNMWVNRDMYVGYGSTKKRTRAFIPFSIDLSNKQISSATFSVYQIYCAGACTYSNVGVYVSGDYDPKAINWNNQPGTLGGITSGNNSGSNTQFDLNVTDALKHWFEARNPSGSKVGSFEFVQENEGTWGYRQWIAENHPDGYYADKKPYLTVNYSDSNASYSFSDVHNAKVFDNYSASLNVTNTGTDSYWDQGSTYANITILNRSTGRSWEISRQIPYSMGYGSSANIPFSYNVDDYPGDYTFYADIYRTNYQCSARGGCYLSDLGVPEGQATFSVTDYPVYSAEILAQYPAAYQAGSTVPVTLAVHNTGRLEWSPSSFALGYQLIDKESGVAITSGTTPLTNTVGPVWSGSGSYLTMQVDFKVPLKTGKFNLNFDIWQNGVGWFSSKGVAASSKEIEITAPSIASILHVGVEDRYAMVGPVDATTGGLVYSVGDVSIPTITGGINIGRNYNSNVSDNIFSSDANGYITKWLVNGPYYENSPTTRFDKSYLNESTIKPNTGLTTNNRIWFEPKTDLDKVTIDLDASYRDIAKIQNTENLSSYANVYVYSEKDQSVQLKAGSDDGIRIWLNGALVHSNMINRGAVVDNDVVPVSLKLGWNRLLIKVVQGTANHGLVARFVDSANIPIKNLKFALNNPDIIQTETVFGKNWSPSFGEKLDITDPENIYYLDGSNSVNVYTKKADGTYLKPAGLGLDLTKNPDGTYQMKDKYGYKYSYRLDGKIQSRTDLSASTINYEYDSLGNCIKIFDKTADGKSTRYFNIIYTNGLVTSITNQAGSKLIDYVYGSSRYLMTVTDQLGNSINYAYDCNGKMRENIDKMGQKILIDFAGSKVTSLTDPAGNVTKLVYSTGKVEVTDPLSHKSTIEFDPIGKMMTKFTDATGYSEKYEYDANYNVTRVYPMIPENDGLFYSTDLTYDKDNNLVSVVDPLNNKTTYAYQNNYPIKQTDASGDVSTNTYDSKGQVLTTTDAKGSITTYTYDSYGHLLTTVDPLGNKSTNAYNAEGDLISVTSPKGETTSFVFNNIGLKTSQKSPLGSITQFGFDVGGRMTSVKDMGGLTTKIEYDKNGNITKQTNPRGFSKLYTYNTSNQLTSITDEVGAKVSYEYDKVGNQTKLIDANGKVTSYEYDALSQLVKVIDSEGKSSTVKYDKNGNITNSSDFNGTLYSQTNNKGGDPVEIVSPDGKYNFKYDKNGNIVEVATTDQKATITYDKNDNASTLTSSIIGNVSNEYDKNDNLTKVTTTSGSVGLTYDANNQISQISQTITATGQTLVSKISLDKEGKLSTLTKANGDVSAYVYDTSQRLSTLTNRNNNKSILSRYSYQYDAASNVTAIAEDRTKTLSKYAYDGRNQLVKDNAVSYTYDSAGNRLQSVNGSETLTYAYDAKASNELVKISSNISANTSSYIYDNIGNTVQKTDQTGETKYTYDTDGYFVKAVLPDKTIVAYTYDKIAKLRTSRVQTNPDGTVITTKFVWDGDRLIAETDGANKTLKAYSWDEEERLVSVSLPDSKGVFKTFYYVKNAKGDITSITDQSGARVADYEYDAWGKVKKSVTLANSPIANIDKVNVRMYAGYWYDATLGSYFMKIRLYDPSLGRFLSRDPLQGGIDPVDYNPYIYCANNPVNRIDPAGKFWHIIGGAIIGAIVGAAIDAAVQYKTQGSINWKEVGAAAVGGAVAGAVFAATAGFGGGLLGLIGAGAISGAAGGVASYTVSNWGNLSVKGAVKSAVTGAVAGAIGGAIGYGVGKVVTKVVAAVATSRVATSFAGSSSNAVSKAASAPFKGAPEPVQYNNFTEAKSDLGSPGIGKQWHHIVEQCQIMKSGFSTRMVNSTDNLVAIDTDVHRKISAYYSSKPDFTKGVTVRNWLASQSFENQYRFGIQTLKQFSSLN